MRDLYEVLGISRAATSSEIRTAYKRLAKLYHPDRNPGNAQAEEYFKAINEAYHILCNPAKKTQYDLSLLALALNQFNRVQPDRDRRPTTWEERQQRYYRWKKAQEQRYKIDGNYFKIQGLAFLVFLIIGGFCFAIIHTAHYYVRKQQLAEYHEHTLKIKQASALFSEGKFNDALLMIRQMENQDPLEYRYGFAKDSLIDELRKKADNEFRHHKFESAIEYYEILKTHEQTVRNETLENLSMCQYYLGNFSESLQALKHLHNQDPHNLILIYQIGLINLEKLNNPEEALQYFTLGKKLFKSNLSHVYGNAFQIVMNPSDAPDIYYYIFISRAKANYKLRRYEDSVTDSNWAIFLRNDQPEPYYNRAMANIQLKRSNGVCDDLSKASYLGMSEVNKLQVRYCK